MILVASMTGAVLGLLTRKLNISTTNLQVCICRPVTWMPVGSTIKLKGTDTLLIPELQKLGAGPLILIVVVPMRITHLQMISYFFKWKLF